MPERGYPFVALAVLIVVVASPVVSLGGTRPLLLGLALAALTVCFLWLERLPLRPGLGVAALVAIALAGALPLAAVADRGEPWFDYRSFAESLGPDDPRALLVDAELRADHLAARRQRGDARHSGEPLYWKARNLDVFDGDAWRSRATRRRPGGRRAVRGRPPGGLGGPPGVDEHGRGLSIRRVRTTDVFGAGTIARRRDASRVVRPGCLAGTWDAPTRPAPRRLLHACEVHVPKPQPGAARRRRRPASASARTASA